MWQLDNYSPWLIYIISSLTSFDPSIEVHIFMVIRSNPNYIYFSIPLIVEGFSTQGSCASFTRRLSSANIWYSEFNFISGFIVWWMIFEGHTWGLHWQMVFEGQLSDAHLRPTLVNVFEGQLSDAYLGPTLVNDFWGAAVRLILGLILVNDFWRVAVRCIHGAYINTK